MLKLEHRVSCKAKSVPKAVVLEENPKELPNDTELRLYAKSLGIDPDAEPDLLWIAKEGISASLPKGWQVLQDENSQIFYYNSQTGVSLWEHPLDEGFRQRVQQARCLRDAGTGDARLIKDRVGEGRVILSVGLRNTCNDRRSRPQSTCVSRGQAIRPSVGNEDWKSTPLLGDEVPASTITVAKVTPATTVAGATTAAGGGDLTDTTTTEYLNLPPVSPVSLFMSSYWPKADRRDTSRRQRQSAVACQTQVETSETVGMTTPCPKQTSTTARYLAELDQADQKLTDLRRFLRRDYLTSDSFKRQSLTVEQTGRIRKTMVNAGDSEQRSPRNMVSMTTPTTRINGYEHSGSAGGIAMKNAFLSPVPSRNGSICCPIVGVSPSEATGNSRNDSDGLADRQNPHLKVVDCHPGGKVHRLPEAFSSSADRHCRQSSKLMTTGNAIKLCHTDPRVPVVVCSSPPTSCPVVHRRRNSTQRSADQPVGAGGPRRQLQETSFFAVNDAFGHLLEERSRLERKLLRLRLVYKTYKQRLANLDTSIQLLHTSSRGSVSPDRDCEKPVGWTCRHQVSVILADQVGDSASRRWQMADQQTDDCELPPQPSPRLSRPGTAGQAGERRRFSPRSSSAPRNSTAIGRTQSCSCCCYAWTDDQEGLNERLANMTLTCDQSHDYQQRAVAVGEGRARQPVDSSSDMDLSDKFHLLESVSPGARQPGRFQQPRVDISPTWQQSD